VNLKTKIGQLSILAIAEGISYLLFALTMPLKYGYDIVLPNRIVGMLHGILFLMYCLWVVIVAYQKKWSFGLTLIGLVASLLPFATFVFEIKVLKKSS